MGSGTGRVGGVAVVLLPSQDGEAMYDLFHSLLNLPTPFNMIVLVVLIGTVGGLIGKVIVQSRAYASHRADLQFKREMVERGLNADEIEQIVAAKSPTSSSSKGC